MKVKVWHILVRCIQMGKMHYVLPIEFISHKYAKITFIIVIITILAVGRLP